MHLLYWQDRNPNVYTAMEIMYRQSDNTKLQEVPVRGDGSCFYRAIAHVLFGDQKHALKVKKALLAAMFDRNGNLTQDYRQLFPELLTMEVFTQTDIPEIYANLIGKLTDYADHIGILRPALEFLYRTNIEILSWNIELENLYVQRNEVPLYVSTVRIGYNGEDPNGVNCHYCAYDLVEK